MTSSEGEKTAKIAVSQKAGSENPAPGEEIVGSLSTADDLNIQFAHDAVEPVKKTLTFTLEKTATAETKVKLSSTNAMSMSTTSTTLLSTSYSPRNSAPLRTTA